jgi:translocator protein
MNTILRKEKAATDKWWVLPLISTGLSLLGKLSAGENTGQEKKIYTKKFKQAPWSPPAWLFGPAWTINNFFLMRAVKQLVEKDIPDKKKLLLLQGLIWTMFFTFNYVYFRKKSPVLATIWTMADNVLALASFIIALKNNKKLAYNYVPLLLWTTFASTLSGYQALYNKDPFLDTKALAH